MMAYHDSDRDDEQYGSLINPTLSARDREEFSDHGLEKVVQLEHRNVCKDGFGQGPSKIDAGQ